jgi:ABC-type nitrate/sulfonate/bicarbonate transport system substrate-binding protein
VPYGYAPILIAGPKATGGDAAALRAFLAGVAKGYKFAAEHPEAAAALLCSEAKHPSLADADFVAESQRRIGPKYTTEAGEWGSMEPSRWSKFVDFMSEEGILKSRDGATIPRQSVDHTLLFTNAYL